MPAMRRHEQLYRPLAVIRKKKKKAKKAIFVSMKDNNKVISLFSGAGGMDIGFGMAGFETAVAVEYDKSCCETLKKNSPNLNVIQGDISNITTSEILKTGGLKITEPALV